MAYRRILKTTAHMGLSSGISAVAGLARSKFAAVLHGSACVGMLGLLNQHYTMLQQVFGLGLSTSALRYVSENRAHGGAQPEAEALSFASKLGLLALVACLPVSFGICYLSFGSMENLGFFVLVGLAAPPAILTLAQVAVLQARGEISRLAQSQSITAILSLVVSLILISFWGEKGVALSIFLSALIGLTVFCVSVPLVFPRSGEWFALTSSDRRLLVFGVTVFGVIALGNASAMVIRSTVVDELGLKQAGIYFAAMAVAVNLPGFLFGPMFADYTPRVAAAPDDAAAAVVTKDQLTAGLLLGGHCFVAIHLWAGSLLGLFFSSEFLPATPLVEWLAWGVAFRLVSIPLGCWLLARCRPSEVMAIEGSGTIVGTVLAIMMLPNWGAGGYLCGLLHHFWCLHAFCFLVCR
jgi:O-antigen/teichoic acid export membrane protein